MFAHQNVCQAHDGYKKYVDDHQRPITFNKGDYVFLKVPKQSKSLKIRPIPKLLPQFCGPFKILKRVGKVAYKLDLPSTSKVHPIFHVIRLRKEQFNQDNVMDKGVLVDFLKPCSQPHEPERVLD